MAQTLKNNIPNANSRQKSTGTAQNSPSKDFIIGKSPIGLKK